MSTASPAATPASNASSASCAEAPPPEACAVIMTPPGEEAQVDYGTGPMVRDPHTGKYRRTRLFVLTLGLQPQIRPPAGVPFQHAHLGRAARAGLPPAGRRPAPDRPRQPAAKACSSPTSTTRSLNPLYRDVLAHYGAVAMPCRVRDPDRKGKVERGVGHAKKTPLKGLRFESLEEAQAYLDRWEERWADTRIHGTTKRQVAAMFAEEKPALLPLPLEPFRYLPVRRTDGASGWLRRSGSRLLQRAAGLDRPAA